MGVRKFTSILLPYLVLFTNSRLTDNSDTGLNTGCLSESTCI